MQASICRKNISKSHPTLVLGSCRAFESTVQFGIASVIGTAGTTVMGLASTNLSLAQKSVLTHAAVVLVSKEGHYRLCGGVDLSTSSSLRLKQRLMDQSLILRRDVDY